MRQKSGPMLAKSFTDTRGYKALRSLCQDKPVQIPESLCYTIQIPYYCFPHL